jgi:manganese/iron transport system substrate-binding protein
MRLTQLRFPALLLALGLAVLVAVVPGASAQSSPRLLVVTSTAVFADMIQRVGGDHVEAFSLVPPGSDIHTFQPTPRDVQRASQARIAIWNGLGLDEVPERLIDSLGDAGLATVTLAEGIEPIAGSTEAEEGEEDHAEHDVEGNPHLWLDPTLAMRYVERIRDALSQADSANSATYEANAGAFLAEIAELDTWAKQEVGTIPAERRKLVTFHDAFPYLTRHFDMELVGVVVKSPGREPSAQEVAELVTRIQAEQIPTVYTEPQFNARILELAARDAGVQVRTLYSDTLDSQVTSYLDLMRYNVRSLVDGLR